MTDNRYATVDTNPLHISDGCSLEDVLPASKLFGANGMRFDADGHLYVAQAFGSQISEVDPATGVVTTVSAVGSDIVAPDDLAFDSKGVLYATEVFSERVSARTPDGKTRVIADNLPVANGIAVHQDRIFVDEFRVGGRVLELYLDGRAPRVIAEDLVLPNALSVGPDGYIYFPLVVNGEIGRVAIAGGPVEIFVAGLSLPTAVKFDAYGRLVVVQSGSGEITRYDIQSRLATTLGRVRSGMDNLDFSASGELYVSNFSDGGISHIGVDGSENVLVERGLLGPYGLAVGTDGSVYIADGMSYAVLSPSGQLTRPSMLLTHGFPGYVRGVAVGRDGTLYFSNSAGGVASFVPGAEAVFLALDLDQLMGLAAGPDGDVIACEAGHERLLSIRNDGRVRVLAKGLVRPTGVAVAADGSCYVSEAGAGRVVHVCNGSVTTVLTGLVEPHGVSIAGNDLYVLDRGDKTLHCISLTTTRSAVVARGLPVGPAAGIVPKLLPGIAGVMPGPLLPFADLCTAADGSILVSGDGAGSLMRFRGRLQREFK